MNKSRFVLALVFIGVLLLSTVAIVSGGQDKNDVCHITGTHDFNDGQGEVPIGHVISVADPAYPAHIEHGDPPAHIEVQLPDGTWVCKAKEGKIVFITSQTWDGAFGTVTNADALCQTAAENGGLATAGEPSFRAWLSDSANDAKNHTLDLGYQGIYVKPNGDLIALNNADLLDSSIISCIDMDEYSDVIQDNQNVWTGTQGDGTRCPSDFTCNNWLGGNVKGMMGFVFIGDDTISWCQTERWTYNASAVCLYPRRLYCFQQ